MRPICVALMIMLLAAGVGLAAGQEARPDLKTFDVATIRASPIKDGSWKMQFTDTGFVARGVGLSLLIEEAYGFDWYSDRVSILPKIWTDRKFDVDARMDGANLAFFERMSREKQRPLLQRLLQERFRLTLAKETREHEAFLLETAKGGPRLGPPLVETDAEKLKPGLISKSKPGLLVIDKISMEALAQVLKGPAGRMVIDRTGLPGRYSFTLHWAPQEADSSEPDLFTALQEQLGLRLVPAKIPVEVVVISHVEEPSEN